MNTDHEGEAVASLDRRPSSSTQFDVMYRPLFWLHMWESITIVRCREFYERSLFWLHVRKSVTIVQYREFYESCGSCGYMLNLNSGNRNTSNIDTKYRKAVKKGMLYFFSIDESRFCKNDELSCKPHISKDSWGLFRRRTKLQCRKCGNNIGSVYNGHVFPDQSNAPDHHSVNGSFSKKYSIKIRALQPVELGTLLLT